jgi:D-alanyl-D-alanine carboxypeptidase-like protein
VFRLLALPLLVVALHPQEPAIRPLPAPLKATLADGFWQRGCPVPLSQLRLLTVRHWGFDGQAHIGQLVVNRDVAAPLAKVFRRLYRLRFPIRHMELGDLYGPRRARPVDGDVTGSFHCRRAVPSPCGSGSGNWSNHAYGHAVDLNPKENPYVGCGAVYDPRSRPYVDRTPLRKGMVTPEVVRAFRSIGWGWGGDWTGSTKDYMHFSTTGR